MKEGLREQLEKALLAKENCEGMSQYCTISIEDNWLIKIYAHPSEKLLHRTVSAFTGLVGKLEKKQEQWGTSFEFVGMNDFFDIRIRTPEQCKIVGYRIEKKPKKVTVETNEIEEVRTLVTDCDFRAGKVKAGEFEPIKEEVHA